jgi:hypothetical protein
VTDITNRLVIRSGGQTGVDRAALDFAIARAIPYGGWCPLGGRAEDLETPPGLLARYQDLVETPSRDYEQRTAWNVRDSHATLILTNGSSLTMSAGTAFTLSCARLTFFRPVHVTDMKSPDAAATTGDWLARTMAAAAQQRFELNVAGPRESGSPGIYAAALKFLADVFPG